MFVASSPVDVECAVVDGHVGVESTSDATSSREESSPLSFDPDKAIFFFFFFFVWPVFQYDPIKHSSSRKNPSPLLNTPTLRTELRTNETKLETRDIDHGAALSLSLLQCALDDVICENYSALLPSQGRRNRHSLSVRHCRRLLC